MKLLSKNKLTMQVLVARVEDEFCEIDKICVGMNQAPIINFKDGTRVVFSWQELCNMAADFKKEEEANKKSPAATKQQD
ncbi:hypothetical protein [Peptoniphilus senegalensis]|uniref:Glutaredoxin n=1 Tax=Peptoniphilus senegalensis TaxID=1465757 RepID=A0ABV1J228_9FIRM